MTGIRGGGCLAAWIVAMLPWVGGEAAAAEKTEATDKSASAALAEPPAEAPHVIYVPYEDLGTVLQGRQHNVLLPYEEYSKLLRFRVRPGSEPPAPAVITRASYVGQVEGPWATFQADIHVRVLQTGTVQVPIRLEDVAIRQATIGDQPALLLVRQKGEKGYDLRLSGQGEQVLKVEFVCPVRSTPEERSLSFSCPAAPIGEMDLTVPEPAARPIVQPSMVAASTQPSPPAGTRIRSLLAQTDRVAVAWSPGGYAAGDQPIVLSAQLLQAALVEPDGIAVRHRLIVVAHRGRTSHLQIGLPADLEVVRVVCPGLQAMQQKAAGSRQQLVLTLAEPLAKDLTLTLYTRQKVVPGQPVRLVAPEAVGVARQAGLLAVAATDLVSVQVGRPFLARQTEVSRLPSELADPPAALAFSFSGFGDLVELWTQTLSPQVSAEARSTLRLDEEACTLASRIAWEIRRAPAAELQVRFPAGVESVEVGAREGVESWSTSVVAGTTILSLVRSGAPSSRASVELTARLAGVSAGVVAAVAPEVLHVSRQKGSLLVTSSDRLLVRPAMAATTGAELVNAAELTGAEAAGKPDETTTVWFGFRYAGLRPTMAVEVSPRPAEVSVRWRGRLTVRPGQVEWSQPLSYTIRYRPVGRLSLVAPVEAIDQLSIRGANIKHRYAPDAGPSGPAATAPSPRRRRARVEFDLEPPVFGSYELLVGYSRPMPAPASGGGPAALAVEPIVPEGAVQVSGQVQAIGEQRLEVQPVETNLRVRRDAQADESPQTVQSQFLADVLRPEEPVEIRVSAPAAAALIDLVIERALVETVVTEAGQVSYRVRYVIGTARTSVFRVHLPEGIRFVGLPSVAGRPVQIQHGQAPGEYQLDMATPARQGSSFLVEFVYRTSDSYWLGATGGLTLHLPRLDPQTALGRLYWSVYLPSEYVVLSAWGDCLQENAWRRQGAALVFQPKLSPAALDAWISAPLRSAVAPAAFETAGRAWLYSTFGSSGKLRLIYGREALLVLVSSAIVLAVGLGLIRARPGRRLPILVVALAVLGVGGLLAPTTLVTFLSASPLGAALALFSWIAHAVLMRRRPSAFSAEARRPKNAREGG